MTPIAWLIGFVLPACGYPGAGGLPTPRLMDVAHIERPASPNTALAAPEGFKPLPDVVTPIYAVPAGRLFPLVREVAASQPRTSESAVFPERFQVHYVVRSAVFNFPDLVMAQVEPDGEDHSRLILYSRSVYGYGDMGVNKRRVVTWLEALKAELPPASEK